MADGPWSPPITSTARLAVMGCIQWKGSANSGEAGSGRPDQFRQHRMRVRWANTIASKQPRSGKHSRFGLGLDDLAPTVKAVRADVVTQMHFTRGRFDRNRRLLQMLVRAMHAALGRRFLVLLYGHGATPCEKSKDCTRPAAEAGRLFALFETGQGRERRRAGG
uniref:Uncharacterized protein n=1 Tax=mine drainage metagenome TaxID=410659 RepID=E6PL32_9ZZZZ